MYYWLSNSYRSRKTVENLPRTRRPLTTSWQHDRQILRVVKSNRRKSLRELTNTVNNDLSIAVWSRTIRRCLRAYVHTVTVGKDTNDCEGQPFATCLLV